MRISTLSLILAALGLLGPGHAVAAPANDDALNATFITDLPFTATHDSSEAAADASYCWGTIDGGVWYAFTPAVSGTYWLTGSRSDDSAWFLEVKRDGADWAEICDGYYGTQMIARYLEGGVTYLFLIGHLESWGHPAGMITFTLEQPPQLEPVVIDALPYGDTVDTGADSPSGSQCWGRLDGATLYQFTAPENMELKVSSTNDSGYYTRFEVSVGNPGNAIGCWDLEPNDLGTDAQAQLNAGETYFLLVGRHPGDLAGNVALTFDRVQPPDNDELGGAVALSVASDTSGTLEGATSSPDDPSVCGYWVGRTVWYTFDAPTSGNYFVEVNTNSCYTDFGVYSGDPGSLQGVACGYPWNCGGTATSMEATAGTRYTVMVGNVENYGAAFDIEVRPAFQITGLRLTSGLVDSRTGNVTVNGVLTCNQDAPNVNASVALRQKVGRLGYADGTLWFNGPCSPAGVPFSGLIRPVNRAFAGGTATFTATADGQVCGERRFCEYDHYEGAGTIKLKASR